MPQSVLADTVRSLEAFAAEDTLWRPLKNALPDLRERVDWLDRQIDRIPQPLVAVLFGGTGTGKSTLLNAIAGAPIALTGERRPTTEEPTVYHPPAAGEEFGPARYVESPVLDDLVLIDMPDTDSVKVEHAGRVQQLLKKADVVLFCGTQQKYKNEQSLTLLRPLKDERKIVCIQTLADQDTDIRQDWLDWLRKENFLVDGCFRVSAQHALGRKTGAEAGDEFEFPALEEYIREKLPPERARIKEANIAGALKNTLTALERRLDGSKKNLEGARQAIVRAEQTVAHASMVHLEERLLNEPHVWIVAVGNAVSERSFGVAGALFRVLHWIRMAPSRMMGRLSLSSLLRAFNRGAEDAMPGMGAAGVSLPDESDAYLRQLAGRFSQEHAEVNAYLARAGFPTTPLGDWCARYAAELRQRLDEALAPVQARINRRARVLTRWILPLLDLAWFVPFAFTIGAPIYQYYAHLVLDAAVVLPEPGFLGRSASMLGAILFIELALFAWLVRTSGRGLRKRFKRQLLKELEAGGFGFNAERTVVQQALDQIGRVEEIRRQLPSAE